MTDPKRRVYTVEQYERVRQEHGDLIEEIARLVGRYGPDGSVPVDQLTELLPSARRRREIDCHRCLGCGQLTDSDDQEPWEGRDDLAAQAGLVRPMTCPDCDGTGRVPR